MAQINYRENGDLAKLKWTLEGGATPLPRIYSTVKHLGSKMNFDQIKQMVEAEVQSGLLRAQPHPFSEGEHFYSLNPTNGSKV